MRGRGDRLDGTEGGVLMMFMARPAADPGHDPVPIPAGAFMCSLWPRSLCLGAPGLREAGGDPEDFLEEVPL